MTGPYVMKTKLYCMMPTRRYGSSVFGHQLLPCIPSLTDDGRIYLESMMS